MKSKKIIIVTVSTVVAIAILWFCFGGKSKSANYVIETAQAVRGDVSEAVTATGTIEPVTQVEVGTQVSGIIDKLYADYNSIVTKGQLFQKQGPARETTHQRHRIRRVEIQLRKS